uniref:Overexpressed in colon carcinoma 1 protein n=1 Tax=Heterorhabditis bacteriophora TaxID=37862 RepID=A0A1I7X7N8_HETBA
MDNKNVGPSGSHPTDMVADRKVAEEEGEKTTTKYRLNKKNDSYCGPSVRVEDEAGKSAVTKPLRGKLAVMRDNGVKMTNNNY